MSNSTCLCLLFILCSAQLLPAAINAGRPPATADPNMKQKECPGEDGAAIGSGGISLGRGPFSAGRIPSFTNFDHSGPAAANGRYIPGFDDTFVPNPGYEVPRSSPGSVSVP